MRISDWSSDVCSSDLRDPAGGNDRGGVRGFEHRRSGDPVAREQQLALVARGVDVAGFLEIDRAPCLEGILGRAVARPDLEQRRVAALAAGAEQQGHQPDAAAPLRQPVLPGGGLVEEGDEVLALPVVEGSAETTPELQSLIRTQY